MNKNRLNHIPKFQLKGSHMNKNCLNPLTQLIGIRLVVGGFVLLPLSPPALATPGTPASGNNGANGANGADGASADGASGGPVGGNGGTGGNGGNGGPGGPVP